MTPAYTFLHRLLGLLILFGWYFATDHGARKRMLATALMVLLVAFSLATIYPPREERSQLGLDIQGGTSFLIRLVAGDKEVTKADARAGGRSDPEARRLFRRRRADHQPGREGPDPGADPGT